MKFFHVSIDLTHNGHFIPRIPTIRAKYKDSEENKTIPRICVGKSLGDCFSAMPNGNSKLDILAEDQKGLFKVFEIDTKKLGIKKEDILDDEYLYNKDLVRDALHTNENWILKEIKVPKEDSYIILLENWIEEIEDIVPSHIWNKAMSTDGDYISLYEEYYPDDPFVPCMVVIDDLKYKIIDKDKLNKTTKIDGVICYDLSDISPYESTTVCYYEDYKKIYNGSIKEFKIWCDYNFIIGIDN